MSLSSKFPTALSARLCAVALSCLLLPGTLMAQAEAKDPEAGIRALLMATQPGMQIDSIQLSPIDGLYEVSIQSGQTIYVSKDARFLIPGDMYQAGGEGLVNLGESKRNVLRKQKIAALDEKDMILFPAEGVSKATITVFTDVDCPYCRKLHGEIADLNKMGISVHYLAYPRTGLDTETHHKMISIWCAEDRKVMFTVAKRGGDVPEADCANPIAEQYQLGREVGVTGTPALVFEDGTILPGYVPAATLAGYLFSE